MGSTSAISNGNDLNKRLHALTHCVNQDTLLDLAMRFSDTYQDLAKHSTEQFLVTPVTALPTGQEKGKFLSIDVGGTNLRVGFIELLGETSSYGIPPSGDEESVSKIRRSYDKSWPIGEHLKMDKAEDLFQWIGDCIAEVITGALTEIPVSKAMESPFGEELLLGITFSFPVAQTSFSEATLLPMGKGFAITSDQDLNLGKMILTGYSRHVVEPTTNGTSGNGDASPSGKNRKLLRLPRIRIAAITNDTVATFASLAYAVKAAPNSRVAMGVVVGTGTNATVPMKTDYLHPSKMKELESLRGNMHAKEVVINTEWTINGTEKPLLDLGIKTKWDEELDRNSDAPGFQPFEYMTSGRYLGEIVRLAFVDIVSRDSGEEVIMSSLRTQNALPTRYLSEVVARTSDMEELAVALEMQYPSESTVFWTTLRVKLMRDVARAVQQRSSALIAAAIVGLLDCVHDIHIDRPNTGTTSVGKKDADQTTNNSVIEELVVAYTGGTISGYPEYLETCQRWVETLVNKASPANRTKRVVLKEALDGGVIGAGVLAGMADRIS
ncbi:actin-like ATPase domain-containing protein [Delitschia confertaspora ATCC 74209]|uniref:Phosphotransferase n=1 Tax=Delitschia confertaspora ATCC 74209 TaxID=1513339 RepID=A0A9P4JUK1_9PLEO|nr:actin-like ATPase domain-containing protein [Delitschia confertaspora ATCC 74209]